MDPNFILTPCLEKPGQGETPEKVLSSPKQMENNRETDEVVSSINEKSNETIEWDWQDQLLWPWEETITGWPLWDSDQLLQINCTNHEAATVEMADSAHVSENNQNHSALVSWLLS
ncbi:Transcription factor [Datura stramonium]|uniref:Transcription factor n=1 Tax=Datura stramonium TaxID=4076 RepID=A0ABS8WXE1_DATST|nr:Transcription factor [Datura stramonium]